MQKLKEFYQYKRVLKKNKFFLGDINKHFLVNSDSRPLASSSFSILYVKSSFSNTIVTLTNLKGKVLIVKSCGCLGFNGKKKRTTKFAIESTLDSVVLKIKELSLGKILLHLNGFAKARFSIINCLKKNNIALVGVRDVTPNPHNGCRSRKLRRG